MGKNVHIVRCKDDGQWHVEQENSMSIESSHPKEISMSDRPVKKSE